METTTKTMRKKYKLNPENKHKKVKIDVPQLKLVNYPLLPKTSYITRDFYKVVVDKIIPDEQIAKGRIIIPGTLVQKACWWNSRNGTCLGYNGFKYDILYLYSNDFYDKIRKHEDTRTEGDFWQSSSDQSKIATPLGRKNT